MSTNTHSIHLIESAYSALKPIAVVCHAPAVLIEARNKLGERLLKGKQVTGFSNSEEEAIELTKIVPYMLEGRLKDIGACYSKGPDWQPYVTVDSSIITGQNPASSTATAQALLATL